MRSRISIRGYVRPSVRPSNRPSVGHTWVEFLKNGLNLNKIASGIWNYAIWKTIQRQVRGQVARELICCPNSVRLVSCGFAFSWSSCQWLYSVHLSVRPNTKTICTTRITTTTTAKSTTTLWTATATTTTTTTTITTTKTTTTIITATTRPAQSTTSG